MARGWTSTRRMFVAAAGVMAAAGGLCSAQCPPAFPSAEYEGIGGAWAVALADLNNDGWLDLISGGWWAPGVVVQLGAANGTFGVAQPYMVGHRVVWIEVGDIDNDGDVDVAYSGGSTHARILFNDGKGGLWGNVNIPTLSNASLALADVDHDGELDIITPNGASVGVVLNMGAHTFAPQVNYTVDVPAVGVTTGDIDVDGDIDIVVAGDSAAGGRILLNAGDGTFASPAIPYPARGTRVALVDLDGDTDLDIAATEQWGNRVNIALNNAGVFTAGPQLNALGQAWAIVAQDLDADGDNDLAVSIYNWDKIVILRNNGNATFAPAAPQDSGPETRMLAAGDIDRDGDLDLAVANSVFSSGGGDIRILTNLGDGVFPARRVYTLGARPDGITLGDVDNDGDLDAVTVADGSSSSEICVLKNNGDGAFAPRIEYSSDPGGTDIVLGDLDGDTDLDMVIPGRFNARVNVRMNNGAGVFGPLVHYPTGNGPTDVALANIDGDTDLDLIVANTDAGTFSVLKNNGNGAFAPKVDYPVGASSWMVALGDVDADGDLDVAVGNAGPDTMSILLNNGAGAFEGRVDYPLGAEPYRIAMGDLDADGDADVVVTSYQSDTLSVLLNTGNGVFASPVAYPVGGRPMGLRLADLEGDGDLDIAFTNVGSGTHTASYMLNAGNATFGPKVAHTAGGIQPRDLALGRLRSPSQPGLDIALAINVDNQMIVLHNIGAADVAITKEPATAEVCPGDAAQFTVAASGSALTFQWRKDKLEIPGATGPTHIVPSATSKDAGAYEVVISNSCSSVTSEVAMLVVDGGACCRADWNHDGVVNSTDVSDFINGWFADQVDGTLITDFDDNGVVNSTDVSAFINAWFADQAAGCP